MFGQVSGTRQGGGRKGILEMVIVFLVAGSGTYLIPAFVVGGRKIAHDGVVKVLCGNAC